MRRDSVRFALIDEHIEQPRKKLRVGQTVKAMIRTSLGFRCRTLYLNPRFYKNCPVEALIGDGVTAADLHDPSWGTALNAVL